MICEKNLILKENGEVGGVEDTLKSIGARRGEESSVKEHSRFSQTHFGAYAIIPGMKGVSARGRNIEIHMLYMCVCVCCTAF